MNIKCWNSEGTGTWIIDTVREFRKAKKTGDYDNLNKYNQDVLEDVKLRVKEGIVSKYKIISE